MKRLAESGSPPLATYSYDVGEFSLTGCPPPSEGVSEAYSPRRTVRASTSLARLQALQGTRDEARTMLTDIYNWFAEGFDTVDLKDAKALLDELSPES